MVRLIGSKIRIDGFSCERGTVQAQEVDLTPFQGQMVRVFLDNKLKLVVNPNYDCFWEVAEVYLPYIKTIQQEKGIVQEPVDEEIYVTRTEGDTDEIPNLAGSQIVSAGFWWGNYGKDLDYEQTSNGIRWLGERRPRQGDQYPVVIRRWQEKIEYENIVEPLDLSKCNVHIFDLPGGES